MLQLSGDRAETVVIEVVVIADVKRRSRIRIPAEQELTASVALQRVVIETKTHVRKARKLIGRAQAEDVRVKRRFAVVVAFQTAFRVIERNPKRVDRLVFSADLSV